MTHLPKLLPRSVDSLVASILAEERTRHLGATHLPAQDAIHRLIDELQTLLFPGFFGERNITRHSLVSHVERSIRSLAADLFHQIEAALCYHESLQSEELPAAERAVCQERAAYLTETFVERLPAIRRLLDLDVQAAFDGDPAARTIDEIIFCYPGVHAIMIHRIAHELYALDVPLLPRIMSEYGHSQTGIDIHPGARIGESFFIDHGTGVVIGETTVIGRNCKVYQGVTLGAKSFPKDERGRVVRGVKRHPTLGDRVTVYASATILGGDTVIGDDCVIAGGVFLTRSVPPGHIVRAKPVELVLRTNPEAEGYEMDASGI